MDFLNTFAALFSNFGNLTWQMVVMWGIGALLIYLAIAKKMEPSLLLPMGFGFVVYENRQQALKALNRFNGKALDGHVLELKFSARKEAVTTKKRKITEGGEDGKTKLLVRNIPFEANRNELRELFGDRRSGVTGQRRNTRRKRHARRRERQHVALLLIDDLDS